MTTYTDVKRLTNEPAVAVVVMSVVSVVSVVVTAEVVAHLVYGGVVGVRTALLHRGESVAAACVRGNIKNLSN